MPPHWRAIDFISDLHLAEDTPRVFEAWSAHLRYSRADAIFILGDLFEVWVGDDVAATSFEALCVEVMRDAATQRTIGFMAGNRDFLVGDTLLAANHVIRLDDPTVLVAFGQRMLLSHGDALCIDDVGYQRYRAVVRRPRLQRLFAALPRRAREAVGRRLRGRSGRDRPVMRNFIDLDRNAIHTWMDATSTSLLVHGHTHAPATHEVAPGQVRHVMTDWHLDGDTPPRAEILRWHAGGLDRIAPETGTAGTAASP